MANVPILEACRALRQSKDRAACVFYLLIAALSVCILLKFFIPGVRQTFLKQFHLKNPYPLWSLLQVVPSMYNYGNEFWISRLPVNQELMQGPPYDPNIIHHFWTNHYPGRLLTFHLNRHWYEQDRSFRYVALRSRYRGSVEVSYFYLDHRPGHIFIKSIHP